MASARVELGEVYRLPAVDGNVRFASSDVAHGVLERDPLFVAVSEDVGKGDVAGWVD